MLTQLPTQTLFIKRNDLSSPPSRALENYAKASLDTPTEVQDIVEISEAAKDQPAPTSSLRKAGQFVALGLSLIGVMGATGCASTTAVAQTNQPAVQTTQEAATDKVELRKDTQQAPETYGQGVRRRTKMITDMFKGDSAEEVAENIGTGSRKIGEEMVKEVKRENQQLKDTFGGKDAEEVAEKVGKEGRRIGQQIGKEGREFGQKAGKVGQEIGQEAAKVGKEIGNVAKGFWRGLTGKAKKAN